MRISTSKLGRIFLVRNFLGECLSKSMHMYRVCRCFSGSAFLNFVQNTIVFVLTLAYDVRIRSPN